MSNFLLNTHRGVGSHSCELSVISSLITVFYRRARSFFPLAAMDILGSLSPACVRR